MDEDKRRFVATSFNTTMNTILPPFASGNHLYGPINGYLLHFLPYACHILRRHHEYDSIYPPIRKDRSYRP
jgi:hypothetical protein